MSSTPTGYNSNLEIAMSGTHDHGKPAAEKSCCGGHKHEHGYVPLEVYGQAQAAPEPHMIIVHDHGP